MIRPRAIMKWGAVVLLAFAASQADAFPSNVHFQARLTNPAGEPIDGTFSVRVGLRDAPDGGNLLWQESPRLAEVNRGLLSAAVGEDGFETNFIAGTGLWFEVSVNAQALDTLHPVHSAPYALSARRLHGGVMTFDEANGFLGIGANPPTSELDVDGSLRIRGGSPADGRVLVCDADGLASWGIYDGLPSNTIVMWSGAVETIPSGWKVCDGSDGAPDLRDRFLMGVDTNLDAVGDTGGAASHTHTVDVAADTSDAGAHTHTFDPASATTSSAGSHTHGFNPPNTGTDSRSHTHGGGDLYFWRASPGYGAETRSGYYIQFNYTSSNQRLRTRQWYGETGSHSHSHTLDIGSTTSSSAGAHTHTVNAPSTTSSSAGAHHHAASASDVLLASADQQPPYYALYFIIKQ